MSRRKDRKRTAALKAATPGYKGFRGYTGPFHRDEKASLRSLVCSVCGRKRNVPAEVAETERGRYVCLSCKEREQQPS